MLGIIYVYKYISYLYYLLNLIGVAYGFVGLYRNLNNIHYRRLLICCYYCMCGHANDNSIHNVHYHMSDKCKFIVKLLMLFLSLSLFSLSLSLSVCYQFYICYKYILLEYFTLISEICYDVVYNMILYYTNFASQCGLLSIVIMYVIAKDDLSLYILCVEVYVHYIIYII